MLEANLTTTRVPELIDPEVMFGLPENLLISPSIAETKIQALNVWKHDPSFLMMAADENVPARMGQISPYASTESTAEMLRRVSNVLLALDASKNGPSHRA